MGVILKAHPPQLKKTADKMKRVRINFEGAVNPIHKLKYILLESFAFSV